MPKDSTSGGKNDQIEKLFFQAILSQERAERESVSEIWEIIRESDKLKAVISIADVLNTVRRFKRAHKIADVSFEEASAFLRSQLLTPREFHFYFSLPEYRGLKFANSIGYCEAISFDRLPVEIQNDLEEGWKNQVRIFHQHSLDYNEFRSNMIKVLYLHLFVRANGESKAKEIANERCERSVDILVLHHSCDFKIDKLGGYFEDAQGRHWLDMSENEVTEFLEENPEYSIVTVEDEDFAAEFEESLQSLSAIVTGDLPKQLNDIATRLRNAAHLHALAIRQRDLGVRLTLLVSALEGMLLTESDRDYIGWKVAERASFLATNSGTRIETYKKIKKLYEKRSSFVHQKKGLMEVAEDDCEGLDALVRNVFSEIEVLMATGYESLSSIIEYLDKLKFLGHTENVR